MYVSSLSLPSFTLSFFYPFSASLCVAKKPKLLIRKNLFADLRC